jgi:hypothetical protein
MKYYFKIKIGYDNEFLHIESLEDLEKAYFAFATNNKVIFSNGEACRGGDIINITEDWHKEMGWNDTHELQDDDWNELRAKGIVKKYTGIKGGVSEKVTYLRETNQTNLIGKNVDVGFKPRNEIRGGGVKSIGEIIGK